MSDTYAGMKLNASDSPGETKYPVPQDLVEILTLEPDLGGDPNRFTGYNPPTSFSRTYGGQVLGQSLMAACLTVAPDGDVGASSAEGEDELRVPHSMHAYFLRGGNPSMPITFEVERLRDGRSFSARRIHAMQGGVPILAMIASFQAPAQGMDHQQPMPEVPSPDQVPSLHERYPDIVKNWNWVGNRSVDIRHIQQPVYLEADPDQQAWQQLWIKTTVELPNTPYWNAAALAYLSDFNLLEPVLRNHGKAWMAPGLKAASLDHAMWFHRPLRADDWILYTMESPSASSARGLSRGLLYNQAGELVASVTQEGMLRVP